MSDNRPIGIFDSGIGGLTVVHEVFSRLPGESVIYFGDTARVPYGSKSARVVQKFALQDILFLLDRDVKMVVAACHTASSVALEPLNKRFHLPILGVVEPGVKAALAVTRNGRVGVIGTRGTVNSRTYDHKLTERHPDIQVFSQPCPLFVPLAEEGWLESPVTVQVAEIYLEPLTKAGVDTLILGCTHYPLLKPVIRRIMGPDVTVIDSAEETAKLVSRRLTLLGMQNDSAAEPEHRFFVSDIPHMFREIGERFLGRNLGAVAQVDLESLYPESVTQEKKDLAND